MYEYLCFSRYYYSILYMLCPLCCLPTIKHDVHRFYTSSVYVVKNKMHQIKGSCILVRLSYYAAKLFLLSRSWGGE